MFCPKCGTELSSGDNFCHNCGNSVDQEVSESSDQEDAKKQYAENVNHQITNNKSFREKISDSIDWVDENLAKPIAILFCIWFAIIYYLDSYRVENHVDSLKDSCINDSFDGVKLNKDFCNCLANEYINQINNNTSRIKRTTNKATFGIFFKSNSFDSFTSLQEETGKICASELKINKQNTSQPIGEKDKNEAGVKKPTKVKPQTQRLFMDEEVYIVSESAEIFYFSISKPVQIKIEVQMMNEKVVPIDLITTAGNVNKKDFLLAAGAQKINDALAMFSPQAAQQNQDVFNNALSKKTLFNEFVSPWVTVPVGDYSIIFDNTSAFTPNRKDAIVHFKVYEKNVPTKPE